MLNASEHPDENSDSMDVELMLKQLLPAPSQLDERELFYQAGYVARQGVLPSGAMDTTAVSRSRNLLLSFSGGLLSGVAACWLLFVSLSSSATVPAESSRDVLLVKEQPPQRLGGDEIATEPVTFGPSSALVNRDMDGDIDWDENAIRMVIYRGNRKVIWNERESALSDSTSTGLRGAADLPVEMNNLNWRRRSSEDWSD
jgi:hypothetical protein